MQSFRATRTEAFLGRRAQQGAAQRALQILRGGLLLYCLIIFPSFAAAAPPLPGQTPLQQVVRGAQSGDLSLDEAATRLILAAERSPDFEAQIASVQIQVAGFAEVIGTHLRSRLKTIVLARNPAKTAGFKALIEKVFDEDSPFYVELFRLATLADNMDAVRSLLAAGLPDFDDVEVQRQFAQRLSAGLKNQLEKGAWRKEPLDFFRRVAEYDAFWATGTTKAMSAKVLQEVGKLIEEDEFTPAQWPLDAPVVRTYLQELTLGSAEAKAAAAELYAWKTLESMAHDQGQQARFYLQQVLAFRPDPNPSNDRLRLRIISQASGEPAQQFAAEQFQQLKRGGSIATVDQLRLALGGYYGTAARWILISTVGLLLLLLVAATAVVIFVLLPAEGATGAKPRRRRRGPGYVQPADGEDEYSQLLAKLGLRENATEAQIKKAFREAAKKASP